MNMTTGPPSAIALRESFGDRKPPDISRKITACVACRKQKIKCHMAGSRPPCTRCKKRGLSCVVNKSLQMILENDVTWKTSIERKVRGIEDALSQIATKMAFPQALSSLSSLEDVHKDMDLVAVQQPATEPPPDNPPQQAWEVVLDPNQGPAAIPASCVSEVANPSALPQPQAADQTSDLISDGVISLSTAETLFTLYHEQLDHFLCRILASHGDLASVRSSSRLLTAAICTVGALHAGVEEYQSCYKFFVRQASAVTFAKTYNFDDVRALCIGAFWLSDISWALVGAAVRIAAELNLHRCISKAPHSKRECYLRTRLYFLVYVCDHHLSVAYGRPPMTREFRSLSSPVTFLDSQFATEDDARLVSQVEIWSLSSRVFDTFGVDTESPLPETLIPQLRRLGISLDTWRADWAERFASNAPVVGNPHREGIDLQFHFAKLYLYSHVFRGVSNTATSNASAGLSATAFEEFATAAIHSAMSVIRTVVNNQEIQSCLNGLPTYFDTMIAFAAVFLLKVTNKTLPLGVKVDKLEVLEILDRLASVLAEATSRMHQQHLLSSIAVSVRKLVERFRTTLNAEPVSQISDSSTHGASPFATEPNDLNPFDALFLENYNFLYPQDGEVIFDLDFDPVHHFHL